MAAKAGAAASFMFMLFLLNTACQAQLSPAFYDSSCPNALSAIRTAIRSAIDGLHNWITLECIS